MLTIPLLALLASHPASLDGYPKRLTVDIVGRSDPESYLLSDDGGMVFDFGGQGRRAAVPDGPLVQGDAIRMFSDRPGHVYTDSQIAHVVPTGGSIETVNAQPMASPRSGRVLLPVAGGIELVRYEARGADPNPFVRVGGKGGFEVVRAAGEGSYVVRRYDRAARRAEDLVLDTRGDRLSLRRLAGPAPRASVSPPLAAALGRRDPVGSRLSPRPQTVFGDERAFVETWEPDGRPTYHEWGAGQKGWTAFRAPVDQPSAGAFLPPRLLRLGGRLFATPYRMGGADRSWTYEASVDRRSWRRVSERILLTVSADRRFCLTYDARTGEAWVERLAEFAGKG